MFQFEDVNIIMMSCHIYFFSGNTLYFHESKRLIGLSGVFIGVGEILGKV